MCTVTFIPFKDSFFLTSNRDESPDRKAKKLVSIHGPDSGTIHFPLDEESGGSWIALSDASRSVCLLNGAFNAYAPTPPYRISRGQVVIDAAGSNNIVEFIEEYTLTGIAPFTMLIFEKNNFNQLIWDGEHKHSQLLPLDQPQIWSSVTLYSPEMRAYRNSLFQNWLKERTMFDRESIIHFHQFTNDDPENDFTMNRNNMVKTLSITGIEIRSDQSSMIHIDLEKNVREEVMIRYE